VPLRNKGGFACRLRNKVGFGCRLRNKVGFGCRLRSKIDFRCPLRSKVKKKALCGDTDRQSVIEDERLNHSSDFHEVLCLSYSKELSSVCEFRADRISHNCADGPL